MQIKFFNRPYSPKIVLTLGFFDCMHLGHMKLVATSRQIAQATNSQVALFTFDNNHLAVLGKPTKLLYTFAERTDIFFKQNIDVLISAHFDKEFMSLTAQQFLDILTTNFNLSAVVCGFDYTCGSDIKSTDYLENYFKTKNISLHIVQAVTDNNGKKISSTMVRNLIINNDIATVNKLLSQPFSISGTVVAGRKVGRTIGFPTANISVNKDKLLPSGVFSGYTTIDKTIYKIIVNIGNAPTFDYHCQTVEVHIIGYNGNLYGKTMQIFLTKFLRQIKHFDSVEQLTNQLQQDVENAIQ